MFAALSGLALQRLAPQLNVRTKRRIMINNYKSILFGVLTYLPLYGLLTVIYKLPTELFNNSWVQLGVALYGLFMLPLCGYIAAQNEKKNGIIVGALTGLSIAIISTVLSAIILGESWYGESLLLTFLNLALSYSFYSALGGGVGELYVKKGLEA